jgi:oligoribonuclease NrnB/cAMP/cGMP phosphodiesterase (DHH superfamily)
MKQLCLYHADSDGFGAAYSVWKRYGRENTDYFSTNYGEAVIDASKYNSIIMVDFSYKRDVLVEMYELLEGNLLVLDHHKSAEDDLKGLPYCVFDVRKSGASLSFAYFNNYNPHIRILSKISIFGNSITAMTLERLRVRYRVIKASRHLRCGMIGLNLGKILNTNL